MKILGIDPGLAKTGWAIVEVKKGVAPVVIDTGLLTTSRASIQAERVTTMVLGIAGVRGLYAPDAVAIERVFVGPRNMSTVETAEVIGALRYSLWVNGNYAHDYAPATIKKVIAGKGNAKKPAVAAAVKAITGYEAPTNHESDAIAVALTRWREEEAGSA